MLFSKILSQKKGSKSTHIHTKEEEEEEEEEEDDDDDDETMCT